MSRFQFRAIVFDMDGVLVDSMPQIADILASWAREHHLEPAHVLRCAQGRTDVELVGMVAPHLDPRREAGAINEVERVAARSLRPVRGAREFVSTLESYAGAWAVVTSSSRTVAEARLRACGFPVPRVLVTADDVTHGKPHPEPYATAARRLGRSPSSCVVIEDSAAGATSGAAAGMTVIGLAADGATPCTVRGAHVTVDRFSDLTLRNGWCLQASSV